MTNAKHATIRASDGNHGIVAWDVPDEASRLSLATTADDVSKVCRQASDRSYWVLSDTVPTAAWERIAGGSQPGPSSGWQVAVDANFTQLPNQAFVDGPNSWLGKTWTGANIATTTMEFALVNGVGLRVKHKNVSSEFFPVAGLNNAPMLHIKLPDLISGYVLGQTDLRITAQLSCNGSKNHEAVAVGVYKLPWVLNACLMFALRHGYSDGFPLQSATLTVNGDGSGSARGDWRCGVSRSLLSMYFSGIHKVLYYSDDPAISDADSNDAVMVPGRMRLGALWRPGIPANGYNVASLSLQDNMYAVNGSDLNLVLASMQQNTSGTLVSTIKRLRVEYRYT